MSDRPAYRLNRIQSVQSLCRALGSTESELRSIVSRINKLYLGPNPVPKKNGKIRHVFDTKKPLKPLLRRINDVFFKRVSYPAYLTGSLPGRDYITNVDIHKGSKVAVTEDIENFFDSISAGHVYRMWRGFFGFGHEVAEILTALTTRAGSVCQGSPTSSYIANLVFWDREHEMVKRLAAKGLRYSRYVDDITISSTQDFSSEDKTWAISQVYGMLAELGLKAQREKHMTLSARAPMIIMGLNANAKKQPTIPKGERGRIRTAVFNLEKELSTDSASPDFCHRLEKVSGLVGRLSRMHKSEADILRSRISKMRQNHPQPLTGWSSRDD